MKTEYFHTRLSVWIVRRFELKLSDAKFTKEFVQNTNKITQCKIVTGNDTLNLMKLGKMCCIKSFIAEYSINTEVFAWFKVSLQIIFYYISSSLEEQFAYFFYFLLQLRTFFMRLYNSRALLAVVWVRSKFFCASSSFQSYL